MKDLFTYFPLADPQVPGVHFQEYYGDVPPATTDAFITRFCASPLTSVRESMSQRDEHLHVWEDGTAILIEGLPEGNHEIVLADASGRVVRREWINSRGGQALLPRYPLVTGLYSLTAVSLGRSGRLVITH